MYVYLCWHRNFDASSFFILMQVSWLNTSASSLVRILYASDLM
jgi:hypothetical protein